MKSKRQGIRLMDKVELDYRIHKDWERYIHYLEQLEQYHPMVLMDVREKIEEIKERAYTPELRRAERELDKAIYYATESYYR